jgi:two-component system cell cycle sensor histidine kinase/response regulator CckA
LTTTISAKQDAAISGADMTSSTEFLGQVLQHISQPFLVTDASGSPLFWNRAFEEFTGFSAVELLGKMSRDLIATDGGSSQQFGHALVVGERDFAITSVRTKRGESIPVEVHRTSLNAPNGDPVWLHLISNISEKQRLEAELRQSQKMESIGKLAGGIAHDFNNVLTTILGLTDSMLNGRTAPTSDSIREIHHSATHAAELTHSLLAFSRRQVLQMKNIRLELAIENIRKMVARLIGEDIRLEISNAPKLPAVRADQSQLEQVLLNLCLNARDAMPNGGVLSIGTKLREIDDAWCAQNSGSRPGKYVVLTVEDTGEGMDSETLQRIFEPFFTLKAQGKGTGLGLSLAYGIVKQHEGFIHVASEVNKGTVISVFLKPSEGEAEPVKARETGTASVAGTATILVVEDEKSVRKLVLEVLANLGYRTFAAANGEEAIKVFERWADQIDLVLLDAIIPKKGAREVYDEIRKRKPLVRFLFTSGYNEVFINEKFELDPSFDFLRKPFTTLELATRIRNALTEGKSKV